MCLVNYHSEADISYIAFILSRMPALALVSPRLRKMNNEKKTLVLTHFPRFLSLLEEEVYGAESPIWDPDFRQAHPSQAPQFNERLKNAQLQTAAAAGGMQSSDTDSFSGSTGSGSAGMVDAILQSIYLVHL